MTNTINTTLNSALFTRVTETSSRSQNLTPAPIKSDIKPIPAPSALAGQLVNRVNSSNGLTPSFKREAILLTAVVDSISSPGRQEIFLNAISSQISRQEQIFVGQGVKNQPPLEDAQTLFNQSREALLKPTVQQEGQDVVSLSPQARGRILVEGFKEPQISETLRNLGSEAVASLFGEPPGVRNPEQNFLSESARNISPQEVSEERSALRESILRRITAGKLPE